MTGVLIGHADLLLDRYRPERTAVESAERAVDAFASDRSDAERHRTATAALHAGWTTLRDSGDERTRVDAAGVRWTGPGLSHRLTTAQRRYAEASSGWTADQLGLADSAGSEREDHEVEVEQIRETSLGRPNVRYLPAAAWAEPSEIRLSVARVGWATATAGLIALALGDTHVYWAVAFAALVLHQGGTRASQATRGLQRLLGTLVGLLLFGLLMQLGPNGWALVALVFTLQLVIELLVVRNYAAAVVVITPLALTIAHASTPMPVDRIITERAIDTVIGVVCAFVVLWASGRRRSVVLARAQGRRVLLATRAVMTDLATGTLDGPDGRERRRHLYYELLQLEDVAGRSLADDPEQVRPYAAMVARVRRLGYLVLGSCWHPQTTASPARFAEADSAFEQILATPVTQHRDAAAIEADVGRIEALISSWHPA